MNKLVNITFERIIDENPDLSYLDQYANSKDSEEQYEQDQKRKRAFYNGEWNIIGIRAKALINIPMGDYSIIQSIETPGVWEIESDSGESYFQEVASEEKEILRDMLKKLNVDMSNFDNITPKWRHE